MSGRRMRLWGTTGTLLLLFALGVAAEEPPSLPAIKRGLEEARELRARGEQEQAIVRLKKLIAEAEQGDWPRAQYVLLWERYYCADDLFDLAERCAALREMLALEPRPFDATKAARIESDLGGTLVDLGEFEAAFGHLARAGQQFREGNHAYAAHNLTTTAIAHGAIGAYAKALTCVEEARRLAEQAEAAEALDYALTVEASLHIDVGEYGVALDLHRRRQAGIDPTDKAAVADALEAYGVIQGRLGRHAEARDVLSEAIRMYGALEQTADLAAALVIRGEAYERLAQADLALADYQRALAQKPLYPDTRGWALQGIGDARLAMRPPQPGAAEAQFRSVLEFAHSATPRAGLRMRLDSHRGLADALLLQSRILDARAEARRALECIDLLDVGLADTEAAHAREETDEVVATALRCALAKPESRHVFATVEACRARVLASALGNAGAQTTGLAESLRTRERKAREQVASAQMRYQVASEEGKIGPVQAARRAWMEAREVYRATLVSVERETRLARTLNRVTHATLQEAQSALRPGDVLVSYVLSEDLGGAVVATKSDAEWHAFDDPRTVAEECEALARIWEEEGGDPKPIAAKLAGRILESLKLPKATKRILISPDGPLTFVPYRYLLGVGKGLPENADVALVPSATVYRQLRPDARKMGTRVLALGDPMYVDDETGIAFRLYGGKIPDRLTHSAAEVEAVAASGGRKLLRKDANETALRKALGEEKRWRMVLLSCHGTVNETRPDMSALALTPADPHDGFLTAAEIMHLDIPADLVVLSACESGLGKSLKGEGTLGLVRAFMCAGAPRVVASLWEVDDAATQALMIAFHEALQEPGVSTAEALRLAQRQIQTSNQADWSHPRYWAAWVLWGLPD